MFEPDPKITTIPATRDQVVAVIESINQPQVSIPGKPAQAVIGHLCGVRNANGTLSIYVALHLPKSNDNVVYVHGRNELSVEQYRAAEVEGLQFLESMGFLLDNLNFRNLSPEVQVETLRRIPLFSASRPAPASPAAATPGGPTRTPVPEASRIARLLASF